MKLLASWLDILRPKFTELFSFVTACSASILFHAMFVLIKQVKVDRDLRVEAYPHFMEKKGFKSYHSTSILGRIYDETEKAISQQSENDKQIRKLSF